MASLTDFPRRLTDRERSWLEFILPADRPGYASLLREIDGLEVIGFGRWGDWDLVLGRPGQEIDRTEGMQPIHAYGEVTVERPDGGEATITLAVHQPNDEGLIEYQLGDFAAVADGAFNERSRWSYSQWSPGEPCPATGEPVRQVPLGGAGDLLFVLSPGRRVLWLYDGRARTNTLIPVTNYYNELMLLLNIRDPKIALDHRLLFTEPDKYSDMDLAAAFGRYNNQFRKIDPSRLALSTATEPVSLTLGTRIMKLFGRKSG